MVDTGPFTLTADYFHVNVDNRLALSQNFTLAADERALLLSEGITSARTLAFFRFFINDFSTRTKGIDVVSTYTPPALGGNTIFSAALNHTETTVTQNSDLLGRLHYYGSWVDHIDARSVRGADAPLLNGRFILDLAVRGETPRCTEIGDAPAEQGEKRENTGSI